MSNKRDRRPAPREGTAGPFPYEPGVVGGKLLMPADCRRFIATWLKRLSSKKSRVVVETVWPGLISKLPPKPSYDPQDAR